MRCGIVPEAILTADDPATLAVLEAVVERAEVLIREDEKSLANAIGNAIARALGGR